MEIVNFFGNHFWIVLVLEVVFVLLGCWIFTLKRKLKREREKVYWKYQRPLSMKIQNAERVFSKVLRYIPDGVKKELIAEYSAEICPEKYHLPELEDQENRAAEWIVSLLEEKQQEVESEKE